MTDFMLKFDATEIYNIFKTGCGIFDDKRKNRFNTELNIFDIQISL